MDIIRSFIAIELPPEVLQALAKLQDGLGKATPPGVKWVDPGSIHLTLKFLGEVAANRLEFVSTSLAKIVAGIMPFPLEVNGLGVFPHARRPRVAWVGLGGELDKLVQLQQAIDLNLATLGFATENRPFVAHLTLARLREDMSPQERQGFGERFLAAPLEPLAPFMVKYVNLMKSQLTPRRAIYSRIGIFNFLQPQP